MDLYLLTKAENKLSRILGNIRSATVNRISTLELNAFPKLSAAVLLDGKKSSLFLITCFEVKIKQRVLKEMKWKCL